MLPEHTPTSNRSLGGAQVLFHKPPSNVEVLNDLDFDIVNFFRVCQWHYEELVRYLRYCLISRKLHELHRGDQPGNPDRHPASRAGSSIFRRTRSAG